MAKTLPGPASLPFRREKILAVGLLSILAPIPLVFTSSLEPEVLALYLSVLGALLFSASKGRIVVLRNAVLNLIGLAYIAVLYADLRFGSRTLLKAMVHVALFTALVKIASIQRERDFTVALALSGFLFLGSMATSFHYAIVLYLVGFVLVAWPVLVRWALWRDLASAPEEWRRDHDAQSLPGVRATAASVAAALLLAVPFFFSLPRLKAPYARGFEEGRDITTGFSETVDPDLYGVLKRSDKVFLRVTADAPFTEIAAAALRFRTLTFTRYEDRTWKKPERFGAVTKGLPGSLLPLVAPVLVDEGSRHTMALDLTPLGSRFVPYPEDAVALRFNETTFRTNASWTIERDERGNVRLPFEPDRLAHYEALYGGLRVPSRAAPSGIDASRRRLGSERVAAFARSLTEGLDPLADPARAAARIEAFLATRFTYSLEIPRSGPNPVEEFLFERKAGHCEAFATAMALSLRELGIPARFVTGFAGGEIGLFGRYLVVRGRDAHAWVEAWCGPEQGWVTFDPTPPAGRPAFAKTSWTSGIRQTADAVELFYDRFVLSFGQGDQIELIRLIRETSGGIAAAARKTAAGARSAIKGLGRGALLALALALLGIFLGAALRVRVRGGLRIGLWSASRLPPASSAYRRLQKTLRRHGAALTPASAPDETLRAAFRFGPEAARPAVEIVRAYVAESFGGLEATAEERERLDTLLRRIRDALAERRAA